MDTLQTNFQWAFHRKKLFRSDSEKAWINLPTKIRDWTIRASAPERALLEVLSEVDETPSSFIFSAELFEGMTMARPAVINQLLQNCTHNKAKRLFLFLSEHFNYPWAKKINFDDVDLGKGKRLVTRGGIYNKKYQITVPENFRAG